MVWRKRESLEIQSDKFFLINLNEFFVLFLGIFRAKKTEEVVKIEESPCKFETVADDL